MKVPEPSSSRRAQFAGAIGVTEIGRDQKLHSFEIGAHAFAFVGFERKKRVAVKKSFKTKEILRQSRAVMCDLDG